MNIIEYTLFILKIVDLFVFGMSETTLKFIKTLDGETFKTDLIPSLSNNVSFISASGNLENNNNENNTIKYSIQNSTEFYVDENSGKIYLISKLLANQNTNSLINSRFITISASNGYQTITTNNQINIVNVWNRPPEFLITQRVFEIEEDNSYPTDILYRNGSFVELRVRDLFNYNANDELSVSCENTPNDPNVCSVFALAKNIQKSTNSDWYGTIRVLKRLNYLERTFYQFMAVAKKNNNELKKMAFQVRVIPNLRKAPNLSSSSFLFNTVEEQPVDTLIGVLNLVEEYDLGLKLLASYALVTNPNEINLSNSNDQNIFDFKLVENYIRLTGNRLFVKKQIDRDSVEFTSIDGIINLWIKVFYLTNPYNCNYYNIKIIVEDIDDNQPMFGLIEPNSFINKFYSQNLISLINENEIGPIIFHTINKFQSDQTPKYLILYDFDLAENSTFNVTFGQSTEIDNDYTSRLPNGQLNSYFSFVPSNMIESKNIFNFFNQKEFDFEMLNLKTFIDSNTRIGNKFIKFNLNLREKYSSNVISVNSIPITISIQDVNDNKPIFSTDTYYVLVNQITEKQILSFEVKDKDSGKYGLSGLVCNLMGRGSERFNVDSKTQKIFLSSCNNRVCDIKDYESIYYLTLICKDNEGMGNVGFASVVISFENIYKSGFLIKQKIYYLMSSGPSGTEIPNLYIKPFNLHYSNKVIYSIDDQEMNRLFAINSDGLFRIKVNQLVPEQSNYPNRIFMIPITITDSHGFTNRVTIFLKLSSFINQARCPRISESAMCNFMLNLSEYDSVSSKFCFYGANPLVINSINSDPSSLLFNQIYFSLLSNSPNYLYINKNDGCVKILPSFDLNKNLKSSYIQYSIGVFNPAYADCVNISPKTCLITVVKKDIPIIKCANKYSIIVNNTNFKQIAYSSNPNSVLNYKIIREERLGLNRNYQVVTKNNEFIFQIDPQNGIISLTSNINGNDLSNQYLSISLLIQINDSLIPISSTTCLSEFRFSNPVKNEIRQPHFMGCSSCPNRIEFICEDVPVNSYFITLNAFDPNYASQSKQLCFSIIQNDYFGLENNQDQSSAGRVILKKKINAKDLFPNTLQRALNFTALLYYCNEDVVLNKQVVTVYIKSVNNYEPYLLVNQPAQTYQISLNPLNSNYSTDILDVIDQDMSPYNSFICRVENEKNFIVIDYDTNKIAIKHLNPNLIIQNYVPFIDLAIKCCDDSTNWKDNDCFSMSKCSMNPIRIEFIDYVSPLNCLNENQDIYLAENTPVQSIVSFSGCITNYTQEPITYQLLSNTNIFKVDSKSGVIYLKTPLTINQNQTIFVQCTNGLQTKVCKTNIKILPVNDFRPIWLQPNPINFNQCYSLIETTSVNSLIGTVRAKLENNQIENSSPIVYSFVFNGQLTNRVYEFEFRDSYSGKIFLSSSVFNTTNKFREITLAASYRRISDQCEITTYQYMCINILPSNQRQPCFRNKPDNSKWSYQIDLAFNSIEKCFFNQIVSISNSNYLACPVYYYIISQNFMTDNIYSLFNINQKNGLICLGDSVKYQNLLFNLIKSPFRYIDRYNKLCYNLLVFASKCQLTPIELSKIIYNPSNCSFNYVKICLNDFNTNYNPPVFENQTCEVTWSLNDFSLNQINCLKELKFNNFLSNKNFYDYTINYAHVPSNLTLTSQSNNENLFYVNKSKDCIAINLANKIKNNYDLVGLNLLSINVKDKYLQSDTINCSIYVTESCKLKSYVLTDFDSKYVQANLDKYKKFLSQLAVNLFSVRDIIAIVFKVYETQPTGQINKFPSSGTTILVGFYDRRFLKFMNNDDIVYSLNANLNSNEAKLLKITKIISSCPLILPEFDTIQIIGLALWSFLLAALVIAIPLILACVLCFIYKKLKYQNSRVIMKEKVIPIVQIEENCCCPAPATCQHSLNPCDEPIIDPCDPCEQKISYPTNLIKGSSSYFQSKKSNSAEKNVENSNSNLNNDVLDAIDEKTTNKKIKKENKLHSISLKTFESQLNESTQDDNEEIKQISSMLFIKSSSLMTSNQTRMSSPVDRFTEYQLYDSVNSKYVKNMPKNKEFVTPGIFKEPLSEIATISYSNDVDDFTTETLNNIKNTEDKTQKNKKKKHKRQKEIK